MGGVTAPPERIEIPVPGWLRDEVAAAPGTFADDAAAMAAVNRLAARSHLEGTGGPFAAIVLDGDTRALVAAGVNLVLHSGYSSLHAEVVTITLAQIATGSWDLGAGGANRELVVNWRPCVMCLGATVWSGVRRLVIAGDGPELEQITGFDEGPPVPGWREQLERRGISVTGDVLREEALDVYRGYAARTDVTVYNARESGRIEYDGPA